MKATTKVVSGLVALALVAAGACGGKANGKLVLGIKDGPPTSSDGRTITRLEVDISKVEIHPDGEGQHQSTGGKDEADGGHADQADAGQEEDKDVVVFDAKTAGGARTVDLLKVTTFSALLANLDVPAGSYGGAQVVVTGARVVFSDAPSAVVPLSLEGDGHSKAEFDFHFKPAAVVNEQGTTLAVIDFVPVVTKSGAQYLLGHDNNDQSGEGDDHNELDLEGTISTVDQAKGTLTMSSGGFASINFANATIKGGSGAAALKAGAKIELKGTLDKKTGALNATKIELQ